YHGKFCIIAQYLHRAVEVRGLVEAMQLALIGEHQVDGTFAKKIEKFVAIACPEKGIGQRQCDAPAVFVRNIRRLHESFFRTRRIPQISLEISAHSAWHLSLVAILRLEV